MVAGARICAPMWTTTGSGMGCPPHHKPPGRCTRWSPAANSGRRRGAVWNGWSPNSARTAPGTSRSSPARVSPGTSTSTTTCTAWCSHSVRSEGIWRSEMPDRDSDGLLVVAPLRIEARALRAGLHPDSVVHAGPRARHRLRVHAAARDADGPVVIAGVAGGLSADMSPGDLVVADQVRSSRESVPLPAVALLVAALRRAGHTVHTGPVVESEHVVDGAGRERLAASGAIAVDM